MKAQISELSCMYDARASFYGKAQIVREEEIGLETLCSYGFPVVQRELNSTKNLVDSVRLSSKWDASPTTLRHVKEYLKQIGHPFGAMSKGEITKALKTELCKDVIGEF